MNVLSFFYPHLAVAMLVVAALLMPAARAQEVATLPEIAELPNPFEFSDGSHVVSSDDWQKRREELKQLFEQHQYGHLPPKPEKMTVDWHEATTDNEREVTVQSFTMNMSHQGRNLSIDGRLTLPIKIDKKLPVVIKGGRFGPPRRPRGNTSQSPRRSVHADRGYALAEVNYQQAARDNRDTYRQSGVYQLYGDDIDCGVLMAWAWSMHRVIDALDKQPLIDTTKVVVTGHSRNGKAALVAGAFDERIAVTAPQHSGCGGAAPYRFIYGNAEQLKNITGFADHWFRPGFRDFSDEVNRLPIDQHQLRALVAPRAQLSTEGTNDAWTNPEGSQLTYLAAKEVYAFLGAANQISIRYRPVGHIPSTEDLLDFADQVFFDKPLPEEFGKLAYEIEKAAYQWKQSN